MRAAAIEHTWGCDKTQWPRAAGNSSWQASRPSCLRSPQPDSWSRAPREFDSVTKEVECCEESSTCRHLSQKHSTYAQRYNIAAALVCTSPLSKRRRWNHADRPLFLLRSENQEFHPLLLNAEIGPFVIFCCAWLRSKLQKRNHVAFENRYIHFLVCTLGVHSAGRQIAYYRFQSSCRGAANPVFIRLLLALM